MFFAADIKDQLVSIGDNLAGRPFHKVVLRGPVGTPAKGKLWQAGHNSPLAARGRRRGESTLISHFLANLWSGFSF